MSRRALLIAVAFSLVFAAAVGGGFAAYDWRLNPGGIFRGPDGTNWRFMYETAISWFVPMLLSTLPVSVGIAFLVSWFRKRRSAAQPEDER